MFPYLTCADCGQPIELAPGNETPTACPHCGRAIAVDAPATLSLPGGGAEQPAVELATRTLQPREATKSVAGQASAAAGDAPPKQVGRFVVGAFLGEGGFGEVYRARDPQLDRDIALKLAKPEMLNSPERVKRFLREAKAAAGLRHPHIVPVFDAGKEGPRYYIAAAFIPGHTLATELKTLWGPVSNVSNRFENEKGGPSPGAVKNVKNRSPQHYHRAAQLTRQLLREGLASPEHAAFVKKLAR